MPHILLTGAGFSRNWGGWLADEAFEYLLGCPQVDDDELQKLLWDKKQGGFEAAIDQLQTDFESEPNGSNGSRLQKLESAVSQMFADMNKALAEADFGFGGSGAEIRIRKYLKRFDATFTLNQDVFLEPKYFNSGFGRDEFSVDRKWDGWQIPGMRPIPPEGVPPYRMKWVPASAVSFYMKEKYQPYFKLHGSSTWFDGRMGREMLVMGGNKPSAIARYPILQWNNDRFAEYLSRPDTRLMVVGYSFGDAHINTVIGEAADRGNLRMFIIDPSGVDVLQREGVWLFPDPAYLGGDRMRPHLIGASRRTLRETFGDDKVEHGKVIRFFD